MKAFKVYYSGSVIVEAENEQEAINKYIDNITEIDTRDIDKIEEIDDCEG